MEEDERFKHLASDPRFRTLRKKQKKVEIDERFQSMFTDEKFTLKYSKDKRGRTKKKSTAEDLRKYYSLPEESSAANKKRQSKRRSGSQAAADKVKDVRDDRTEREVISDKEVDEVDERSRLEAESSSTELSKDQDSGSDDSESEVSSSSDESESEVEDGIESEENDEHKIEYNWKPLDHDAETSTATSKRLAVQNLDWDRLDVRDIYTLVNSVMPPLSVKIYVSEFGKERLKREEVEGPQEIADMPQIDEIEEEYNQLKSKMDALNNREPKTLRINEYEDADEGIDPKNEEIRERIRRYQLNRMKYYYAVIEFDSIESAETVYKELDGSEYEGSSLELDLRFIPDDVEFDPSDLKAECNKMPDLTTYKAPQFISSALQQTTVKFTWDETDSKRQDKLRKAFTKEELEKDDLEVYLASESDSEEELEDDGAFEDGVSVVTANSEARANKYKQLLKSLEEEEERKKKVEVDIEWGNYDKDEEQVALEEQNDMEDDFADDFEDEKITKKKEKREDKKRKKSKKKADDDELDLLVMDAENGREEFKFNPDDERFKAVYESGLYNVDPSHPNFKRTEAFDMIAEQKRKKRLKTSAK